MLSSITEIISLINTTVSGRKVSLAILNQIKEKDQNIMARITDPYLTADFFIDSGRDKLPAGRIYTILSNLQKPS